MSLTLVIDAHPDAHSLTSALARRYADAHGSAELLPLRGLEFDPILRFGYRKRMAEEPDLSRARHALHAAERIVIATPVWWRSAPALLQGFFDRALLPQTEYRLRPSGRPEGLLGAAHGRLLLLADTPPLAAPIVGRTAERQIVRGVMRFCGIRSVRTTRMMGVRRASTARIEGWLDHAARLGAVDAHRDAKAQKRRREPRRTSLGQASAAAAASSSSVATS